MQIDTAVQADHPAIRRLLLESFPDSGEANLVDDLHNSTDAAISLTAKFNDQLVGHVMFSAMKAPFKALGLGPVAVEQSHRKRGIGEKIIKAGLAMAKDSGWQMAFVLGNPDYYRRFGFSVEMAKDFDCAYAGPYFMALALQDNALAKHTGRVEYAPAFAKL